MAKRWNVHHGNENLGLKTAKEIREALRKGSLDPFDKVSAEGSNIREDLIEVDEIFKETEEEEDDIEFTSINDMSQTADQSRAPKLQAKQAAAGLKDPNPRGYDPNQPRTNSPPIKIASSPAAPSPSWRNEPSMVRQSAGNEPESKDAKATQKRYYLIDKSKILGPLSALEIQSLYNRSMLNQKVKVQRIGGAKAIPVAQFISSYSEDRLKELTDDGKMNQKISAPNSKVLNELARAASAQKIAKTRKNKTYMIMAIAGLVIGILIFIIVEASRSTKRPESGRPEVSEKTEMTRRGTRPKLLQNTDRDDLNDDEQDVVRPRPPAVRPRPVPVPAPIPRKVAAPEVKRPKVAAPVVVKTAPSPAPTPPPAAPRPVAVPRVVAKPAPAVPSKGPIAKAMSSGGGIQTIGPLTYSAAALEACPSKCTLILRDATGASIKAVFFKSAYYDALKKSNRGVFLTGTAKNESGEPTIFIQDVR